MTGRNFTGHEAASWGLVSRVVEGEGSAVVDEAVKVAGKIARMGRIAVQSAKEGVNAGEWDSLVNEDTALMLLYFSAYELSLNEGLHLERRLFHQLFATVRHRELKIPWTALTPLSLQNDQKIGMKAFAEKKKPVWTHS